jgi:hypothetical protein
VNSNFFPPYQVKHLEMHQIAGTTHWLLDTQDDLHICKLKMDCTKRVHQSVHRKQKAGREIKEEIKR